MIRNALTTALTLALGAGSVLAEEPHQRDIYGRGEIFQNIAAEHVVPLLRNTAWVAHWENGEGMLPEGGWANIVWFDDDGSEYDCLQDSETGARYEWATAPYSGVVIEARTPRVRYPLNQTVWEEGTANRLMRYDGATGGLTAFAFARKRWWEADVGHLQERIPAVVWDICPTFPSAASLGTTVNTKQTSRRYFELLQQDPGRRILRPQYVNENAHEWIEE